MNSLNNVFFINVERVRKIHKQVINIFASFFFLSAFFAAFLFIFSLLLNNDKYKMSISDYKPRHDYHMFRLNSFNFSFQKDLEILDKRFSKCSIFSCICVCTRVFGLFIFILTFFFFSKDKTKKIHSPSSSFV